LSVDAAVIIAVLRSHSDLSAAVEAARSVEHAIWCVIGKGKFATVSDSEVRTTMRAAGFVDNKTSGVSERWTATQYGRRRS
jgi:hypothetical protein